MKRETKKPIIGRGVISFIILNHTNEMNNIKMKTVTKIKLSTKSIVY